MNQVHGGLLSGFSKSGGIALRATKSISELDVVTVADTVPTMVMERPSVITHTDATLKRSFPEADEDEQKLNVIKRMCVDDRKTSSATTATASEPTDGAEPEDCELEEETVAVTPSLNPYEQRRQSGVRRKSAIKAVDVIKKSTKRLSNGNDGSEIDEDSEQECKKCEELVEPDSFEAHAKTHYDGFRCASCTQTSDSRRGIRAHIRQRHGHECTAADFTELTPTLSTEEMIRECFKVRALSDTNSQEQAGTVEEAEAERSARRRTTEKPVRKSTAAKRAKATTTTSSSSSGSILKKPEFRFPPLAEILKTSKGFKNNYTVVKCHICTTKIQARQLAVHAYWHCKTASPFKCSLCDQTNNRWQDVVMHQKLKHKGDGEVFDVTTDALFEESLDFVMTCFPAFADCKTNVAHLLKKKEEDPETQLLAEEGPVPVKRSTSSKPKSSGPPVIVELPRRKPDAVVVIVEKSVVEEAPKNVTDCASSSAMSEIVPSDSAVSTSSEVTTSTLSPSRRSLTASPSSRVPSTSAGTVESSAVSRIPTVSSTSSLSAPSHRLTVSSTASLSAVPLPSAISSVFNPSLLDERVRRSGGWRGWTKMNPCLLCRLEVPCGRIVQHVQLHASRARYSCSLCSFENSLPASIEAHCVNAHPDAEVSRTFVEQSDQSLYAEWETLISFCFPAFRDIFPVGASCWDSVMIGEAAARPRPPPFQLPVEDGEQQPIPTTTTATTSTTTDSCTENTPMRPPSVPRRLLFDKGNGKPVEGSNPVPNPYDSSTHPEDEIVVDSVSPVDGEDNLEAESVPVTSSTSLMTMTSAVSLTSCPIQMTSIFEDYVPNIATSSASMMSSFSSMPVNSAESNTPEGVSIAAPIALTPGAVSIAAPFPVVSGGVSIATPLPVASQGISFATQFPVAHEGVSIAARIPVAPGGASIAAPIPMAPGGASIAAPIPMAPGGVSIAAPIALTPGAVSIAAPFPVVSGGVSIATPLPVASQGISFATQFPVAQEGVSIAARIPVAPGGASIAAPIPMAPGGASIAAPIPMAPGGVSIAAPIPMAPGGVSIAAPIPVAPGGVSIAAPFPMAPRGVSIAAPIPMAPGGGNFNLHPAWANYPMPTSLSLYTNYGTIPPQFRSTGIAQSAVCQTTNSIQQMVHYGSQMTKEKQGIVAVSQTQAPSPPVSDMNSEPGQTSETPIEVDMPDCEGETAADQTEDMDMASALRGGMEDLDETLAFTRERSYDVCGSLEGDQMDPHSHFVADSSHPSMPSSTSNSGKSTPVEQSCAFPVKNPYEKPPATSTSSAGVLSLLLSAGSTSSSKGGASSNAARALMDAVKYALDFARKRNLEEEDEEERLPTICPRQGVSGVDYPDYSCRVDGTKVLDCAKFRVGPSQTTSAHLIPRSPHLTEQEEGETLKCMLCEETVWNVELGIPPLLHHAKFHSSRPSFSCSLCSLSSYCVSDVDTHIKEKHMGAIATTHVVDMRNDALEFEWALLTAHCFPTRISTLSQSAMFSRFFHSLRLLSDEEVKHAKKAYKVAVKGGSHNITVPELPKMPANASQAYYKSFASAASAGGGPLYQRNSDGTTTHFANVPFHQPIVLPTIPDNRRQCAKCSVRVLENRLTEHIAVHADRQRWRCSDCSFQDSEASLVRKHIASRHRGASVLDQISDNLLSQWVELQSECFPDLKVCLFREMPISILNSM